MAISKYVTLKMTDVPSKHSGKLKKVMFIRLCKWSRSDELTALKLISTIFEKGLGGEKGHDKFASRDKGRGGGGGCWLYLFRLEYTKKLRLSWHVVTVAKGVISILNIKTTFHSLRNACQSEPILEFFIPLNNATDATFDKPLILVQSELLGILFFHLDYLEHFVSSINYSLATSYSGQIGSFSFPLHLT